jgi:hypothetical protein
MDILDKVRKKIPFLMGLFEKGGSRGYTPWAASPSGGVRGSLSFSV